MITYKVKIDEFVISSLYALVLRVGSESERARVQRWLDDVEEKKVKIREAPVWYELPEWVKVVTKNADGKWYGYDNMPLMNFQMGHWSGHEIYYVPNNLAPTGDDLPWYNSIYVRGEE